MPADIRNFQSQSALKYNREWTMLQLINYSKHLKESDPSGPNFNIGYLPEMQFTDESSVSDVFMRTINKTFDIDGAQCIRFILLDKRGQIYDGLDLWTQVLPDSFLARVSCSYRNFGPESIVLDYFIDLNSIQLNNEAEYGSTTITMLNKEITSGYAIRDNSKIQIDSRIAEFNNHKPEIFIDFFKYDFGNAIKGTKLAK